MPSEIDWGRSERDVLLEGVSERVKSKVSSGLMDGVGLFKGLLCLVGRNLNSGDTVKTESS